MTYDHSKEPIEIEGEIIAQTQKAWLIREEMTMKEVWLPKSVGSIVMPGNDEGVVLFSVPQWWCKNAEVI